MEINKEKSQKKFKKVKEKVNLYKNLILNSPSEEEEIIKENIKNKKIQREINDQKNLDFINNNNIIKEAVAYSKLRHLKKNLAYNNNSKTNTNYDFYTETFPKRIVNTNNNSNKDIDDNSDIISPEKKYKRSYDQGEDNPNENNKKPRFITYYINTNNEYKPTTGKNKIIDMDRKRIKYDDEYTNDDIKKKV